MKIYICRHGETEWSRSGRHTSYTDLALTPGGVKEAEELKHKIDGVEFSKVLVSPLLRARQTAEFCGYTDGEIVPDLTEWNYGEFEGLTTPQIRETIPGWTIFNDGAPGGESVEEVSLRADRVLENCRSEEGDIAIFSSGHFSRVLAARWLGLSAGDGRSFALSTATLSILGYERDVPVLLLWNS